MSSRLLELSQQLASDVSKVDHYLQSNNLPGPSFDANGPIELDIQSNEVADAKASAISSSLELLDLLQGPIKCMLPMYNGTSLQAIFKFDIAAKVPLEGQISYQDLAKKCGIHVYDLTRIVRFAICFHRLFKEPDKDMVAHSAGSRQLANDPALRATVGQSFDDFYGSFARGFALAHNTDLTMFEYLDSEPAKAKQFSTAMKVYADSVPGNSPSYLIKGYPWQNLPQDASIVDVGGSSGYVSVRLANAFPQYNFIVQDLPEVIDEAVKTFSDGYKPPNLSFHVQDFFKPQQIVADVYLFRWIFHNWPDKYVLQILRQILPALKKGARVIINESICPEPDSLPLHTERSIRFMDMIMLTTQNSRLRSAEDWALLIQEVDPRFAPVESWKPQGAALSIVEAVWQG